MGSIATARDAKSAAKRERNRIKKEEEDLEASDERQTKFQAQKRESLLSGRAITSQATILG